MAQTVAPRTDIIRQRNAKFVCGFREELGSDGGLISCEIDAKELEASGLTHQPSTHACVIRHRRRRWPTQHVTHSVVRVELGLVGESYL